MPEVPKNAKLPSDRQPKAEAPLSPEETFGWELMKPMSDIPVWDQMPLIDLLQTAFNDSDSKNKKSDEEIDAMSKEEWELYQEKLKSQERSFDVRIIGDLAKALLPYAVDEAAYTKFASGAGAMQRVMTLAMAWVGQMGESGSSEA
jgi:hypothetical protein